MNTKAQQTRLKENLRRKRGLRAIDAGTVYDVGGGLIGVGRQIRKGECGPVSEAVLILKVGDRIDLRSFGRGDMDAVYRMAMSAARRAEGNPYRGTRTLDWNEEGPACTMFARMIHGRCPNLGRWRIGYLRSLGPA